MVVWPVMKAAAPATVLTEPPGSQGYQLGGGLTLTGQMPSDDPKSEDIRSDASNEDVIAKPEITKKSHTPAQPKGSSRQCTATTAVIATQRNASTSLT